MGGVDRLCPQQTTKQLELWTELQVMLNPFLRRRTVLLHRGSSDFSIVKIFLHYIRGKLNRIRWQENRQFTSLQERQNTVPTNYEQANKLFIATEQERSLSERARMQRIDNILGTSTHFHETKLYQERLDSDHIMDLEELKRQREEPSRKTLNWTNPQANVRIRYKNKRKYYQGIARLRTYPRHEARKYDFNDEINENTINFLGKEAVYSKISLKEVELTVQSMQNEVTGLTPEKPFESHQYSYFRPLFSTQLFRIKKSLYKPELQNDERKFEQMSSYVEQIISLDEIHDIMKDYDEDERVNDYLKRLQNGRLEYFFTEFTYDRSENIVAIVIDLLGTRKQYCLIVKNLSLKGQGYKHRVIFNMRPQVVFNHDGQSVCFIQRSAEGGWIELVSLRTESTWYKPNQQTSIVESEHSNEEIVYRCPADKQLLLGTDSNKSYIFLTIRDYKKEYTESLFLVHQKMVEEARTIEVIEVDISGKCKYFYDVCPLGIIFTRFEDTGASFLKYGSSPRKADEIILVPFKQHIQIHQQEKIGLAEPALPGSTTAIDIIPPTEFDMAAKKSIFKIGEHEYIRHVEVRISHIIMVLNLHSIYDRAILYFLPLKGSAHPHSLILAGGSDLQPRSNSFNYNKQIVEFSKYSGLLETEKIYNIWKRELTDGCLDLHRYQRQTIKIDGKDGYSIDITLHCRSTFAGQKNLPVLIYYATRQETVTAEVLRQFLEKGVIVLSFEGRGTFSKDLTHLLAGCRQNFPNLMDDLQSVIEFTGNNLTKNISLYCKGKESSLVGLLYNIYFPFLFNTSVLHNGLYDLQDFIALEKEEHFFGPESDRELWQRFNIFKYKFRRPQRLNPQGLKTDQIQIGTLQNVIISSDPNNRLHSRKLIHRLRENSSFSYKEVYLREYENEYQTDLQNLSYIYLKIRQRMEEQINDPSIEEEEFEQYVKRQEESKKDKQTP